MYRILVVEDERPINDLIEMNLTESCKQKSITKTKKVPQNLQSWKRA